MNSLWGRVAHGVLVEPDHREGAGEGVYVVPELLDLRVLAPSVGEGLAVGLDLPRVRGDLMKNSREKKRKIGGQETER